MLRHFLISRKRDLAGLLLLALANAVLFWDLLFKVHGQLSWGNYLTPYSVSQIRPSNFLYEPNFLNGTLTLLSPGNLLNQLFEGVPLSILSLPLGLDGAIKVYALLATTLVSFCFFFLVRTWGVRPSAAIVASLFFSFNDFQVYLIGEGDFVQFVAEAFLLLSLGFLALWIRRGGRPFWFLVAAFGFLALTAGEIQITLLGGALFVLSGFFLTLHQYGYRLRQAARPLARFLVASLALVPLFAYVFLPLLSGNYLYSSGSPTALTLQGFTMRSEPFWQVLQLIPSVPLNQQAPALSLSLPGVLTLWQGVAAVLLLVLLGGFLVVRDLRLLWIDLIILLAAAFGSGPSGPVGGASSYLYLHFAPYASLNAPYYWQWVPISILYGISLAIISEVLLGWWLARPAKGAGVESKDHSWLGRLPQLGAHRIRAAGLLGVFCVTLLVAVSVLTPVASSAAYGPWSGSVAGIQGTPLPGDYSALEPVLSDVAGSSGTGVAFFPGTCS